MKPLLFTAETFGFLSLLFAIAFHVQLIEWVVRP